jgi:hypothetical protein
MRQPGGDARAGCAGRSVLRRSVPLRLTIGVVEAGAYCAAKVVAADLNNEGDLAPADELVGRAIGGEFDKFAFDAVTFRRPDSDAVAIARAGVPPASGLPAASCRQGGRRRCGREMAPREW